MQCGGQTYPLLSAVALMSTALLLTSPLCLWVFLLVRLQGSVEKGFFTPRFFSRKLLLLRMTAQAISEETILDFTLYETKLDILKLKSHCISDINRLTFHSKTFW